MKSLVRLQQVVKGKNVKRQTNHAIKQMQLLVRVQTQIQTRRIQMLENQAPLTQSYNNDKESETTVSKFSFNRLVRFRAFVLWLLSTFIIHAQFVKRD